MIEARRPKNKTEAMFYDIAKAKGWSLYRAGWPDYLCERNGKAAAVEVKPDDHHGPTLQQNTVMTILARCGVACYVWTPRNSYRVTPEGRIVPLAAGEAIPTPVSPITPSYVNRKLKQLLGLVASNQVTSARDAMRALNIHRRDEFLRLIGESNGQLTIEKVKRNTGRPTSIVRLVDPETRHTVA